MQEIGKGIKEDLNIKPFNNVDIEILEITKGVNKHSCSSQVKL